MPTYVFKGRNRLNEIVVGERVADNRDALRQILRREQVTLTSVKEKGREIGIPKIGGRKKVKSKDLSIFTRQFSDDRRGTAFGPVSGNPGATTGEQILSADIAPGSTRR